MSDSVQPYGLQPSRLFRPWDSPGKNTGEGCRALSRVSSWPRDRACGYFTTSATWEALFYVLFLSLAAKSCPILETLWTVTFQLPLSMGFSRQEYWSRWPLSSPEDLSNPGIKPRSLALQADSLPTELWGKPCFMLCAFNKFLVMATAIQRVGTWIWW